MPLLLNFLFQSWNTAQKQDHSRHFTQILMQRMEFISTTEGDGNRLDSLKRLYWLERLPDLVNMVTSLGYT